MKYLKFFILTSFLIFQIHGAENQIDLQSIPNQLMYSTVRIETDISRGTGFLFKCNEGKRLLVTNNHVIKDSDEGTLVFNKKGSKNEFIQLKFKGFYKYWFPHPNNKIDLCVLPLHIEYFNGQQPFFTTVDKSIIPNKDQLFNLSAVENILMVGYPQGVWDKKNNFPLFRKGISASHPAIDFEGEPKFLADIAAFPGSSGSPIFIYDTDHQENNKFYLASPRIFFMGVINLAHLISIKGDIKGIIPEFFSVKSESYAYSHLGYVIRSEKVKEFESLSFSLDNKKPLPECSLFHN